ncbi:MULTISPECIES: 2-hydroxymuconate tautomerase [Aminobacterium]|jgi:4-oxalocrotonate tautomerase|uniref:2-hydroxymuconate tautomerase n=1 Tax=Aminobacterium TaxID=81466 RepID=UPI0004648FB3|nr:2-hydroxymuconate tautomerase [Aminobacterium mobile]
MPIVNVHILEGRTVEQKRRLVHEMTQTICSCLDVPAEKVRIIITDMKKSDFAVAGVLASDRDK